MIISETEFRENITKTFLSYIDNIECCKQIENSIYVFTKKEAKQKHIVQSFQNHYFQMIYQDKLKSLWYHFKQYPQLVNDLKSGSIDIDKIAFLTHQELIPEKWKEIIDRKIQRDKHKYELNKQGVSKQFKCSNCKTRETTYYQMQTRSADEPMTTFVTCLNCQHHWKC